MVIFENAANSTLSFYCALLK